MYSVNRISNATVALLPSHTQLQVRITYMKVDVSAVDRIMNFHRKKDQVH